MKLKNIYADFAGDFKKRFATSNYKVKIPIPNKKIGLVKDGLDGKIMKEFIAMRPKTYSYLTDDGCVVRKAKNTKSCVIKREIKFEDYKKCIESNKTVLRTQERFRTELHNIFMEKANKMIR